MNWIAVGAFSAAITVALGALGAHSLKETLGADGLDLWRTAAQYQGLHALALVGLGLHVPQLKRAALSGWCFLIGSLLFSGSIYGLALGGPGNILGPITPIGGVLFIVGWVSWGVRAMRGGSSNS